MLKNSAKGLNSSKWLLLACAVSAAAVDIIIIAMLIAGGEAGEFLACPFLLLIFDAFYFAVSLFFTNFRFKYSIGVWVSYIILYTLGFSIGISIILGGDGTVITNGALALWACVHAFNIVCAAVCALFASRVIKNSWFAIAVAAVFVVGAAVYAGFTISDGFFGQGNGKRTLVYSYDRSTGQYTVTGVLAGRSDTVRVPETFNGKPVTAVSFKVFAEKGVKEYTLPDNVDFIGENALSRDMHLDGKRINVDKKKVNDFRQRFLNEAGYSGYLENAVKLANATLPVNLAENEGYVAFNYKADGFERVKGNTIPVYVGELDKFDFSTHTAGFDYVMHREDGSAFNYYWAYNNGGYILSDIAGEDGNVFGRVTKSTVADVKFERVYRIKVDNGNDNMYCVRDKQPELCFDEVGGTTDYKYLTKPKASTHLDGLNPRAGFTYRWLYYITTPTQNGKYFTDLAEVLDDDITVSTRWELNKPTVSVSTSATDNTITYGDNVTLLSEVEHEAEGIAVRYEWYYKEGTQVKWSTQNVNFAHPRPSERSGVYTLRVVVGGNDVTSLGAVTEAEVELKINPKQITFDWQLPENTVYDGNFKNVSVSIPEGQEVEGHPLDYTCIGVKSFKDAGTYTFSIVTDVTTDLDYRVTNPKNSVTIQQCPVAVDWSGYENLEYNGSVQCPAATATGVPADGALTVNVSGGSRNAGTFTATATTTNLNYRLTGATRLYTIAKKPLTITSKGAIVAYGKVDPKPVASSLYDCEGFVEGDGVSSLGGTAMVSYEGKDVGEYDNGVKIWGLTSINYEISYVYGHLTIGRCIVELKWSGTENLVYDGTPKNVTAVVANKGYDDDDIRLIITGGDAINAGDHVAVAEIDPNCEDAENYSMTTVIINGIPYAVEKQKPYTIQKRTVTTEWYVSQNHNVLNTEDTYVYNGRPYNVCADIPDTVNYDKQLFHAEGETYPTNAGTYTYTLVADESIANNYIIENGEFEFTITKGQSEVKITTSNGGAYDEIWVRPNETLSWQGNFPSVEIRVYYSYDGGNEINYIGGESIRLQGQGEYKFRFVVSDTSDYDGTTVDLTVHVSDFQRIPEVV